MFLAARFNRLLLAHTLRPRLYSTTNIQDDIKQLVSNNKVVVFMKGVPEQPRCGFSNAVVQILRMHGVKYDAHDVLEDESLREGLLAPGVFLKNLSVVFVGVKVFSNWPTIPQVYLNGEFLGGCDIMLQMHQSGDLIEELEKVGVRSALLDKNRTDTKTK